MGSLPTILPPDIPTLTKAIRDLHGAEGTFTESVPVTVRLLGDVLWDGQVAVFTLPEGSLSPTAYAWSYDRGAGPRHVAVLHAPGVTSPLEAVRGWLVMEARKLKAAENGERP